MASSFKSKKRVHTKRGSSETDSWAPYYLGALISALISITFSLATTTVSAACPLGTCKSKEPIIQSALDDLVVMQMPEPLFSYSYEPMLASRVFFEIFDDKFDAIFVLYNLSSKDLQRKGINNPGSAEHVSNYVYGIGLPRFSNALRYGSEGRLKILIRLSTRDGLIRGPSLHKFMHLYGVGDVVESAVPGHWGFSSANGQLGGFDKAQLEDLGNGTFTAGKFGLVGNFGNSIAYSPIELYLAGWLPKSEVPVLLVAKNAKWVGSSAASNSNANEPSIFEAESLESVSIDQIVEKLGPRNPPFETSRKNYQAAVILLTDEENPATTNEVHQIRKQISDFSALRDVRQPGTASKSLNFWTATGGRATITMKGLNNLRRPEPTESDTES